MPETKEETNAIVAAIQEAQRKNDERFVTLGDALKAMHIDVQEVMKRVPASATPKEPIPVPVPTVEVKKDEPETYLVRRGSRTIERKRKPEKPVKRHWLTGKPIE